jgi:hypothetical protein
MAGGAKGKSKDPSMLEDDYFIMANKEQKKKFIPGFKKKKPALNYSGKIGMVYK